ncbi:hypothetical protein [Paenisporosarcina quisquiliarum]|uniref:hypothetical protein n=1 Tax=Paenisporosarcina quisquiliarum TaxID=365346 RepID=UPI0037360D74
MRMISRNFKKIGTVFVAIFIIMVGVIIFANANRTYSASEVLGNYADLNAENPFVDIESIDVENEKKFTSIEISEDMEQELIEAFKNTKFIRVKDGSMDYDYRVNITLNTGYAMWIDSNKKLLKVIDTQESYSTENDSDFFEILENITE